MKHRLVVADCITGLMQSKHFHACPAPLKRFILAQKLSDGAKIYMEMLWGTWIGSRLRPTDELGRPTLRFSNAIAATEIHKSERTIQTYRAEAEKAGLLRRHMDDTITLDLPRVALKGMLAAPDRRVKQTSTARTEAHPFPIAEDAPIATSDGSVLKTPSTPSCCATGLEDLMDQRKKIEVAHPLDYLARRDWKALSHTIEQHQDRPKEQERTHHQRPSALPAKVPPSKAVTTVKATKPTRQLDRSHIQRIVMEVHRQWMERKVSHPTEVIAQAIHCMTLGWAATKLQSVTHGLNWLSKALRTGTFRPDKNFCMAAVASETAFAESAFRIMTATG